MFHCMIRSRTASSAAASAVASASASARGTARKSRRMMAGSWASSARHSSRMAWREAATASKLTSSSWWSPLMILGADVKLPILYDDAGTENRDTNNNNNKQKQNKKQMKSVANGCSSSRAAPRSGRVFSFVRFLFDSMSTRFSFVCSLLAGGRGLFFFVVIATSLCYPSGQGLTSR